MCTRTGGKPEQALEYFQKALEIDEELKDIRGKATRLNNIGIVYRDWGKPGKALEYFQKSLKLFEELNDAENIAGIMKNIKNLT
ncbi:MAG: TPR repeat-containing protein [Candidatus Methanoperedens nitroreducens]|uniref:TPR repeat-containing protein n=1 Tax=Candidatus Methanoperedens nitratireducens TaxID=1392998 RepID=A0A0N8KQC4_9EURY|nr:MAG: TPR repeat-containing protein [Candidatus Methanoperedens sp. BLZ1]